MRSRGRRTNLSNAGRRTNLTDLPSRPEPGLGLVQMGDIDNYVIVEAEYNFEVQDDNFKRLKREYKVLELVARAKACPLTNLSGTELELYYKFSKYTVT